MILLKNRDRNPSFKKGEYVEINDAGNYPMELSVDGVCEQEITTGKNLLDYVSNLITSANGLKNVINDDGSITTTGKPSKNYTMITNFVDVLPYLEDNTEYTLSQEKNNKIYLQINAQKKDGTVEYLVCTEKLTFTVNKALYSHLYLDIQTGKITDWGDGELKITNKYMLSKGTDTADTSFEPYTGGQPSPSPDYPQEIETITGNLKLTSCGKNLFNKNDENMFLKNLAPDNSGKIISVTTDTSKKNYIRTIILKCKPNTTYTISKLASKTLYVYDSEEVPYINYQIRLISDGITLNSKYTFTTSKSAKYIVVKFFNTWGNEQYSYDEIVSSVQIEESKQATPYEPYQGSSLNITIPENEFVGKLDDTYKDTLKVVYKDDGQYHLNLYKRVYKNNSYNGESYNYYISTTARKDGNIECGELQTGQVVYYDGDETIIDLGIVDQLITYNEITNLFTDSDLLPVINVKYYKDFEFDKILRSGYNIDEQEYEIAKKQMANGKRKRILSSYDDCIIKINLGLLDNKTYQEYKEQLDDGEFHYWSYKYNQYKKANFILTKPSITTEYAYDDDIGINDMEIILEKSSDIE